jgi:hypothetical protein
MSTHLRFPQEWSGVSLGLQLKATIQIMEARMHFIPVILREINTKPGTEIQDACYRSFVQVGTGAGVAHF